jgi:hypothetical protein
MKTTFDKFKNSRFMNMEQIGEGTYGVVSKAFDTERKKVNHLFF